MEQSFSREEIRGLKPHTGLGGKSFDVWRDLHLRISGPGVAALQQSFAVDWNYMGQPLIEDDTTPDSPDTNPVTDNGVGIHRD
jgi:phosphatidylserine/phosphatidylglycerophosphate/cardiolipin synthase-like enzyme